jgi:deoxyribonuclease V
VRLRDLHAWDVKPAEAIVLQRRLASRVISSGDPGEARLVAAADVAYVDRRWPRQPGLARAAAVLLSYPELDVVEQHVVEAPVAFPYVPGLLSFRETPVLAMVLRRLRRRPQLLLVDGQGRAHPRRFGIACHVGLLTDVPTIGVAKSRLCGEHGPLGVAAGSRTELTGGGEVIGLVLRTRSGVAPLYVSTGHRIGLAEAAEWVLRLCRGVRLPEPIRLADRLSKGHALRGAGGR